MQVGLFVPQQTRGGEVSPSRSGKATGATRTCRSGKSSYDMNKKDDEIAHLGILARTANPRNCAAK